MHDNKRLTRPSAARRLWRVRCKGWFGAMSCVRGVLSCHSPHSTPLAANDAFAAGLTKNAMNLLAAAGETAAIIGAAE